MGDSTTLVNVEREALERFKLGVIRKHGSLRGYLQEEATAALEAYQDELSEGG